MDRRADEADYLLENLLRMREEVVAHPEWLEPNALERLDKAIASIQEVRLAAKAA
jgi:hypothetical protein